MEVVMIREILEISFEIFETYGGFGLENGSQDFSPIGRS